MFYIDDGVLCGSAEAVSEALQLLQRECATLGLDLNMGKSELVLLTDNTPIDLDLDDKFPSALLWDEAGQDRVLRKGNFDILGAPIGSGEHCGRHAETRIEASIPLLVAIAAIPDPQVALRLLRRCSGFCKLVYSMRAAPSRSHRQALAGFDGATRCAFSALAALDRQSVVASFAPVVRRARIEKDG